MQRINSKQKGITLIALVVTVILLLILAGVTINGFLGDGGFLKTVTDNQKAQRIETTRTKIEIIVTNHVTQKTLNDNVTEDDLFQDLIDGDIAESRDDITGTNGKYEVTTKDGDIFEIIIDENGDVKVEYIGDKEGGIIKIGDIQITEITNKTVSVKTNIRNPEGEYSYTYSYKKKADKEYTTAKENTTSNTFTFPNLEPGTKYDIKVTVAHSKGTTDMYATTTTSSKITPTIVIEKGNVTTNSIAVTVKVTEAPEKLPTTPSYHYYIKKSQEEYNQEANHTGTETTNTFANLTQGTSYDIKVTTKDLENNEVIATLENVTTGTVGGATGNLQSGNLIASSPKWNPSTHTATVDLTTPTNLIIQWQVGGVGENGWTTSNTATDLKHGDTLYARLTDGKNAGKEAGVTILDDTDPTITVTRQGVTTKSITVNVASSDAQSGMPTNPTYNYYIKKTADATYPTSVNSSGVHTSYTFENLDANTSYDIQVTAADVAGRTGTGTLTGITTNTIAAATAGLKSGAITAGSPNWNPSSHTASITLSTTTGLTIQWQKNSISESGWTTSNTVTGLAHGDTLYARLTDGKNSGQHAGISIFDGNNPEPAVINDLPSTANPGTTITANVTHTDNQSGIDLSSCKWIFNTTSGNLGTTNSAWNTAISFGNSNSINITVPNASGASYYLHVLSVDMAGNKRENTSGAVSVIIKPIEGTTDSNTAITTTYGKIDVVWLNEKNEIVNEPNEPILGQVGNKMTPIKWVVNQEKDADETNIGNNWYEYKSISGEEDNNTSRWANAKTADGSMWVWIPRYAYRITYYKSQTDRTITGYYDGYGMWNAENKKIKYLLEDGIETVEDSSGNKYIVHPAFGVKQKEIAETDEQYATRKIKNINLGGWDSTLRGFWFAKFEMSNVSSDPNNETVLASLPGKTTLRVGNIGFCYTKARESTYNQNGSIDIFDNQTSFMHSHMIKNSEWGAVTYLTYSQYGRNGGYKLGYNSTTYAGGGETATAYTAGSIPKQSSTGNVYGIYDLGGARAEITAIFNTDGEQQWIGNQGKPFAVAGGTSNKYATAYSNLKGYGRGDAIYYNVSMTGDATKEILVSGTYQGWLENSSLYCVSTTAPYIVRGGHWGAQSSNYFDSVAINTANQYNGMRTALCP